jgi:CheY-like chemotaxis protein
MIRASRFGAQVPMERKHASKTNMNFSSTILESHLHPARMGPEIEDQAVQRHPGMAPRSERTKKNILLSDDDPGVREMLGRVLESENYEVILAKDGNETAAKFVENEPDIVLLDLNMPERDGWSALRFMNAVHPLLPVIIITARPNQYPQADDLGVDGLMEKPLNLPVLLEAIKVLLAETDEERTRRLTNPRFKTALLSHHMQSPTDRGDQ